MKIVFFGSGEFALPSLRALADRGVSLVVTKPDAPRGRGRKIYPQEVRLLAEELGLPCEQPEDCNDPSFVARLAEQGFELGVVVSFGVILTRELFDAPTHGCINAHASLLPLFRGAAPIQYAIKEGEERTGITIIKIGEALDAGDILLAEETPIEAGETAGELHVRLATLSGEVLVKACEIIESGAASYTSQDHAQATRAPKVEKVDGVIDWSRSAEVIALLVRAMTPKPGAQTRLGAKRFIILEGEVEQDLYGLGEPGKVQSGGEEGIRVCTGKELYRIIRIKPENGRNMTAGEFVRGHPLAPDERFG